MRILQSSNLFSSASSSASSRSSSSASSFSLLFSSFVLLLLLLPVLTSAASSPAQPSHRGDEKSTTTESFKPCQTRSPNSGSFFDLTPIQILPPVPDEDDDKSHNAADKQARADLARTHRKGQRRQLRGGRFLQARADTPLEDEGPKSWHARGHDYPSNFTLNFCGPVVEDVKHVVGVDKALWGNVSAYYTVGDSVFSLGTQNSELVWRGRKLTMNYTHGSPCPKAGSEHKSQLDKENWSNRRKSTLISLLCERDPLMPKVTLAFVGTNDECTYFFEARSSAACPALQIEKQQVGPRGVFGLIFGIAFLVYLVGGVVYQRAVMHQRGWRQLPNYALWHGIVSFVQDFVVILFTSCARCLGLQRKSNNSLNQRHYSDSDDMNGYASENHLNGVRSNRGEIDENRLIDELDEEWHD